jgi:tetratricopeptide (TPR) repeat protein
MSGVDWTGPLIVLAVGLVLGTILVARLGARGRAAVAASAPSVEHRDLEGKRRSLFVQLRELEDTAAKRTPAQLARERYALELEAARAWRDLDRLASARPAAAPGSSKARRAEAAAATVPSPRAGIQGFLWGAGTAVAVGFLVLYVSRVIKPRDEGGSVTGNLPTMGQGAAQADPEEQQLREALARNPDDHDTRVDLAQHYLGQQDLMSVYNETQYVLQRVPDHPRALAYQALVRLAMGQGEAAVTMLKKAQKVGPELLEPHLHLALVQARLGRMKEAEATMAEAQRRFPDQAPRLGQLLAQMREVPAQPAADHPQVEAPAAAPAPAKGVAGVIELAPGLAGSVSSGALVFVTARAAGESGGPPVAVKRLPAAFPLRFELSAADSMMGQELPAKLRLEARVDSDGDPLTRAPSDPAVRLDGVALGTANLKLVLKPSGAGSP